MKKQYQVSEPFLEKIAKMTNFDKLTSGKLPETFNHDNKCFIPVGSCSSGALGYISVSVHEVIPIEKYTGNVKPLPCWEHHREVEQNKRQRGYHAQLLKQGNNKYVMIDPMIDFVPIKQAEQLSIFK